MTTDASALVIPFGKHKGSTIAELLVKDPTYAAWVANQGWVAERFAELHAAIRTRGAGTDDSPEHNAIQVRFLEPEFREACLMLAIPEVVEGMRETFRDDAKFEVSQRIKELKYKLNDALQTMENVKNRSPAILATAYAVKEIQKAEGEIAVVPALIAESEIELGRVDTASLPVITDVRFERHGVDVMILWNIAKHPVEDRYSSRELLVELKPTMGDDFPAVMRQMERLRTHVLVVGEYTGTSVPPTQLRQMFAANGCVVISVRAIEAEVARQAAKPLLLCAP